MASLSVRQLDDEIYARLKERAKDHGISMEEEARRLITRAVTAPESLAELARRCFGPEHGVDLDLPPRESHEPLDLGE